MEYSGEVMEVSVAICGNKTGDFMGFNETITNQTRDLHGAIQSGAPFTIAKSVYNSSNYGL